MKTPKKLKGKGIKVQLQPQKTVTKNTVQQKSTTYKNAKIKPNEILLSEEKRKQKLSSIFQESEVIDENADIDELLGEDVTKFELWVLKKHYAQTSVKIRNFLIRNFEKLGQTFPVLKKIHSKARIGMREIKAEITGKKGGDKFSFNTFVFLSLTTIVIGLISIFILNHTILKTGVSTKIIAQIEFYEEKVDKRPNDADLRVQLGRSYLQNKEEDKAINQFNRALDIEKNYYPATLNLAITYQILNNDKLAIQYGKKAILISKNQVDSYLVLANSYKKLKDFNHAYDSLVIANQLSPNSSEILVQLGEVAEKMGDSDSATKYYQKALSFDPGNKKIQKAITRLMKKKE
jgi:tetratricopeptide (TPR) repeat protein